MKTFIYQGSMATGEFYEDGFDLEEIIFFTASKENDGYRVKLFFFNGLEREIFLNNKQYKIFIANYNLCRLQ